MVEKIKLEVSLEVAHLLLDLLSQLPYKQSAPIISDIFRQVEVQRIEIESFQKEIKDIAL